MFAFSFFSFLVYGVHLLRFYAFEIHGLLSFFFMNTSDFSNHQPIKICHGLALHYTLWSVN